METSVLVSESTLPAPLHAHPEHLVRTVSARSVRSSGQVAACWPRSCIGGAPPPPASP